MIKPATAFAAFIALTFLIGGILLSSKPHTQEPTIIGARSIVQQISGKTSAQKYDIITNLIQSANIKGKFTYAGITVEVQSVQKINISGNIGIEVLARAWKGSEQLGFGADGTTDIERFRIFFPSWYVPDDAGPISISFKDYYGNTITQRYSENVLQATVDDLVDTIRIVGKTGTQIVAGSVGHTTSTYYSEAGGGGSNTTVDGVLFLNTGTWAGTRGAAAAADGNNTTTQDYVLAQTAYTLQRMIATFNTNDIGTDAISSATYSMASVAGQAGGPDGLSVSIVSATPAANNNLVLGDYDQIDLSGTYFGSAPFSSWAGAADGTYVDMTLDAAGRAYINKTGVTPFGVTNSADVSNTAPTGNNYNLMYMADQGSTKRPKLVVVHAPAAVAAPVKVPDLPAFWFFN